MLHKIHLFLLKGQAKGLSTCLTTFYKPFPTPGTYTFTYMFICTYIIKIIQDDNRLQNICLNYKKKNIYCWLHANEL